MEKGNTLAVKPGKEEGSEFRISLNVSRPVMEGDEALQVLAYAFDENNKLVETKPVPKGEGVRVEFTLKNHALNGKVRLILGPPLETAAQAERSCMAKKLPNGVQPTPKVTPKMVLARGGVEAKLRLNKARLEKEILLSKEEMLKWLLCRCKVKGRLVKEMGLPNGAVNQIGVCQACVYIWEVDRWCLVLQELPERELLRIRDDLMEVIENWPPVPGPGPYIDKIPIRPQTTVPFSTTKVRSNLISSMDTAVRQRKFEAFETIFTAPSIVSLRQEMLSKADLLLPYLCYFPWIYSYLHKDFIACACTDSEGYFEREISYPCAGDKPDLYFTAYQCIDGNWVTLYDPGMRCHVYWNYKCGTDVLLVTHEPGAKVSFDDHIDPPMGVSTWVEPHGVGGVNLFDIDNGDGTISYSYEGCLVHKAPFGAYLGFRMGKSNNVPCNDVFYYRLQYRKGLTGDWYESCEPVTRHYIHEADDKITYPTLSLGPVAVNGKHLYRFRPKRPYDLDNTLDKVTDQWPEETWFGSDLYAGYLNTTHFPGGIDNAHGLYQIKIEVYNASGSIVSPDGGAPSFKFIMPNMPDSPSVTTETIVAPSTYRDGDGFIFNIAVDNRSCSAAIDIPVVDGIPQETFGCGFLNYEAGDTVKIAFHARHPGNNALVSFTLKRGDSDPDGMGMSMSFKEVATALYVGDYTDQNDGDFHRTVPVGTLLGTCTNAAFAQSLYVYAKAFNGWSRIAWYEGRSYDASALCAFALALE